ncbi:glutathione S-transferase family protein [Vibrio coralliilyticus]|uniref:glutathione S-transferase family protein n=1 Tax=Vibrio coralliilyticus TaxID=190893 RepID=UPI000BAB20DA|nr:glutathione S-transferase family protein [Vibrio coralliilyticus]NOI58036.1 glutathione S-transferase family protein [Vibrio coralliilyticus]PAT69643.1 glutathione S-transferase [Vibrio coralliilyticus]
MKLYAIVGSPNSRKVLAVINHLGLDIEIEYLDLFSGEHKQPEYVSLNPNAMVPTLVDGDVSLWESNAIIQYLAENSGINDLYPNELKVRADINRWLCWELAHFNQAFGTLALEAVAKPRFLGVKGDDAVINWAKQNLVRLSEVLERHLEGRKFMVGDAITLADYAIVHVEFFKESIPFDWDSYPNINDYFARMRNEQHWAATAPSKIEDIGRATQG